MQRYLNEKTNFFERIMQISEYHGYKNITDFSKNALNYSSPEKLNRLKEPSNKPSVDIITDISNKFENIDIGWLITGKGSMINIGVNEVEEPRVVYGKKNSKGVPLVKSSAVAGFNASSFTISDDDIVDYYIVSDLSGADFFIPVVGDSMSPKYEQGDRIACAISHNTDAIMWGNIYLVSSRDHGLLLKRLCKSTKDGYVTLASENPKYESFDLKKMDITGIALVKGAIRLN